MRSAAGKYLKEVREKLGLKLREVQERSARIAKREKNPEFYVSPARLVQIEKQGSAPSIYKLSA